jgi:hypothetical protein
MADFATTIKGQTVLVPRLTVAQIVNVQSLAAERARAALLKDLEDAGCDPDTKLERLERHRRDADLVQYVIRQAFSVTGAQEILSLAYGGNVPPLVAEATLTEQTDLALRALGLERPTTQDEPGKPAEAPVAGNQ